ncbi:hypothetical protein [Rhodospirillum sp. A1_3_36]|uniref:hypothetical protein n=1 Tax=Rhodospirillum sp. A1_3_36 TaxID=3391666 RepID=UPI0039A6DF47
MSPLDSQTNIATARAMVADEETSLADLVAIHRQLQGRLDALPKEVANPGLKEIARAIRGVLCLGPLPLKLDAVRARGADRFEGEILGPRLDGDLATWVEAATQEASTILQTLARREQEAALLDAQNQTLMAYRDLLDCLMTSPDGDTNL